jgi:hypothetical protein
MQAMAALAFEILLPWYLCNIGVKGSLEKLLTDI